MLLTLTASESPVRYRISACTLRRNLRNISLVSACSLSRFVCLPKSLDSPHRMVYPSRHLSTPRLSGWIWIVPLVPLSVDLILGPFPILTFRRPSVISLRQKVHRFLERLIDLPISLVTTSLLFEGPKSDSFMTAKDLLLLSPLRLLNPNQADQRRLR